MIRTVEQECNEFLVGMFDRAAQQFRQTPQCALLAEQIQRAEQDCRLNFPGEDYGYIETCLEATARLGGEEGEFLYRQGYRDCLTVLKQLARLA